MPKYLLHLRSFKTPPKGAVMSDEDDADCAFSMRKGVKVVKISNYCYTIAHSKRRPVVFGVFECALATVTLPLINLLCYIQQTSNAGLRYIKSAV